MIHNNIKACIDELYSIDGNDLDMLEKTTQVNRRIKYFFYKQFVDMKNIQDEREF